MARAKSLISQSKELLYKYYVIDKIHTLEIGKLFGCHESVVFKWLGKFEIPKHCKKAKISICPICGNEFKQRNRYSRNSKIRVCSPECHYKYKTKERVTLTCKNCGKLYEKRVSVLNAGRRSGTKNDFCSYQCSSEYKVGENSPSYIKDRSLIKNQYRPGNETRKWKNKVIIRDNYTCQLCGYNNETGTNLCCHHIKRLVDHRELAYDVNNGIILCTGCHKLTLRKETKFEIEFINLNNIKTYRVIDE